MSNENNNTKPAHTPGPWHVSETNNLGVRIYSGADHHENKSCHLIATAAYFREATVQVANARLIAAAPDLLEALEVAYYELVGGREATGDKHAAILKARAALAKAKGE